MPTTKTKAKASQDFVPIKEIRDGVVVLEDGSMRMILMTSSLNFALKSAEEQEAIINQYQEFLNSLDFSVQFSIQSRYLNIEPYLGNLAEAEKKQFNELLKVQMKEYIDFIRNFVSLTEIVSKTFYVVIPYVPPVFGAKPGIGAEIKGISKIFENFLGRRGAAKPEIKGNNFEEYKNQLQQRAGAVIQGLIRTGVRSAPLNTEELVELFYTLYNPGELAKGGFAANQKEISKDKS